MIFSNSEIRWIKGDVDEFALSYLPILKHRVKSKVERFIAYQPLIYEAAKQVNIEIPDVTIDSELWDIDEEEENDDEFLEAEDQ